MFGYVLANRASLDEAQRKRYRGVYCGLCAEIGHTYGKLQRLALSYDVAFLVLLLSSLYEPQEALEEHRCILHPFQPQLQCRSAVTAYGAAMNVALAYYQCLDDWRDEKKLLSRAEAAVLKSGMEAVTAAYPRQVEAIEGGLADLAALEEADVQEPDQGAAAFGGILAELFVLYDDRWQEHLRTIGGALGRYIYLLDAALDLPEDLQAGRYNPFRTRAQAGFTKEALKPVLQMLLGEATEAFEALPLVEDVALMRNILYAGVWLKYEQEQPRKGKEGHNV